MEGLLLLTSSPWLCWVSGEHFGPQWSQDLIRPVRTFIPCLTYHSTLPTTQDPRHPWPQWLSSPVLPEPGFPGTVSLLPLSRTHLFILQPPPHLQDTLFYPAGFQVPWSPLQGAPFLKILKSSSPPCPTPTQKSPGPSLPAFSSLHLHSAGYLSSKKPRHPEANLKFLLRPTLTSLRQGLHAQFL